ncbi:MAG: LCP family protein [Chloroflexota bacterium]|nr:LCP family protein [Chloroflexota bacterium]
MHESRSLLFAILILGLLMLGTAACAAPALVPDVAVTRVPLGLNEAGSSVGGSSNVAEAAAADSASLGYPVAGTAPDFPDLDPIDRGGNVLAPLDNRSGDRDAVEGNSSTDQLLSALASSLHPLQETHNVLLLGMDQWDLDYVGRTDTIMLLAVDQAGDRAAVVSFPRDTYLPIPGVGYSRINTAYTYGETRKEGGGIPLLISTLEKNFGVPIHNYVRIDLSGFEDIVDALGGVDVTVDCLLYDEKTFKYFGVYQLEPGEYHMDGPQALHYARARKTTSDFDRARRQQRVLLAIRKRVLEGDLISRIPALWAALRDTVDTDLAVTDLVKLAKFGATVRIRDLKGMVIKAPLVNEWITPQGGQVQLPDLPAIQEALDNIWARGSLFDTNSEDRLCP